MHRGLPALAAPAVSFILPCYNYGRFLGQAIESLLGQTFKDLEVIVIDDASTDDTASVAASYLRDPRLRVIHHAINQGHIRSYNEGLSQARGSYLGLLSADDFAAQPDAVARQVDYFTRFPDVGLVYSAHMLVDARSLHRSTSRPWESDYVASGLDEFKRLVWLNYVPAGGTLVRRSCHEQLGWYEPALPHAGDWDLWLRISTRYDVAYVAEPLYAYRVHDSNMSHTAVEPGQAMDELLLTLDRNFARLPSSSSAELTMLWQPARRRALFAQVWLELAHGRTRRAWRGLLAAIKRSPRLLLDRTLYTSGLRVVALTLVGPRRYGRIFGGFGV